jgi:hypothetical protein
MSTPLPALTVGEVGEGRVKLCATAPTALLEYPADPCEEEEANVLLRVGVNPP